MYTVHNYRTKAELKRAVKAGAKVGVYQPGPFGGSEPSDGVISLEGPHFPEPHRWYARATLQDGLVVKVS